MDLCGPTLDSQLMRSQRVNSKILFIPAVRFPRSRDLHNSNAKGQEANKMASVQFDADSALLEWIIVTHLVTRVYLTDINLFTLNKVVGPLVNPDR